MTTSYLSRALQALALAVALAILAAPAAALAGSDSGTRAPDWFERYAAAHPFGDGVASRICLITNVDESGIGYSKRTDGPSGCTTSAVNGISVGLPSGMETFHSFPSHVVTRNFESGVNAPESSAAAAVTVLNAEPGG